MRKLSHGEGVYILVEGGDGSGKSTQYRKVVMYFRDKGFDVVATHEPGGGDEKYREMLLQPKEPLTPEREFEIFLEDRALHYARVIIPERENGKIVLGDRDWPSSKTYQGYAGGVDLDYIDAMNERATRGVKPDMILLYDVDPVKAKERQVKRGEHPTWFERKPLEFHEKVRGGYLQEAKRDPDRWRIINALPDENIVWQDTKKHIDAFFLRKFDIEL